MKSNRIFIAVALGCIGALNASIDREVKIANEYGNDIFIRIDRVNGTGETRKLIKAKTMTVKSVDTISRLGLGEEFDSDWKYFFTQQEYEQDKGASLDFAISSGGQLFGGYGRWTVTRGGERTKLGRKRDALKDFYRKSSGRLDDKSLAEAGVDEAMLEQGLSFLKDKAAEKGKEELLINRDSQRKFLAGHYPGMSSQDIDKIINRFEELQRASGS